MAKDENRLEDILPVIENLFFLFLKNCNNKVNPKSREKSIVGFSTFSYFLMLERSVFKIICANFSTASLNSNSFKSNLTLLISSAAKVNFANISSSFLSISNKDKRHIAVSLIVLSFGCKIKDIPKMFLAI